MARCIAKPVHSPPDAVPLPFAPVAVPRGAVPLPCPIVWSRYRAPWSCAPRVRLGGRARCPHRAAAPSARCVVWHPSPLACFTLGSCCASRRAAPCSRPRRGTTREYIPHTRYVSIPSFGTKLAGKERKNARRSKTEFQRNTTIPAPHLLIYVEQFLMRVLSPTE